MIIFIIYNVFYNPLYVRAFHTTINLAITKDKMVVQLKRQQLVSFNI